VKRSENLALGGPEIGLTAECDQIKVEPAQITGLATSNGGLIALRQLGDIRCNPPRLILAEQ